LWLSERNEFLPPFLLLLLSEPGLSGLIGLPVPPAYGAWSGGRTADIEPFPRWRMMEIQYAARNEDMNTRSMEPVKAISARRPLSEAALLFALLPGGASFFDDRLDIRFPYPPHRRGIPIPVRNNRTGISDIRRYRS